MEYRKMSEEQVASVFWEGLRCVARGALLAHDDEMYRAIRQVGEAGISLGVPPPGTGEFVTCPVCQALPGQACIGMPGRPLGNGEHRERAERCRELVAEIRGHRP